MTGATYQTWDKAVMVPVSSLVFTDWNCNVMSPDKLAELMKDIENKENPDDPHFDEPLQAVPIKGKDKLLVLGGEHRTKIMTALSQKEIPCVIRQDLAHMSRKDLMMWSVRRNNLRGKIDAQKYAELENELVNDHDMAVEAARQSMLLDDDLAEALKASVSALTKDTGESTRNDSSGNDYESDGEEDAAQRQRDRHELLQALKVAEQDVLLDSADTVEHGYLFFTQGKKGQMHLVVDESSRLHELVAKMVSECKGESASVDEFLCSALQNKLKKAE